MTAKDKNAGKAITIDEHDTEMAAMANRIAGLAKVTDWDLPIVKGQPLAGKPLQEWLLEREARADKEKVERGIGYMLLRRELGHGAWLAWLKDHGLSPRSIQEANQIANFMIALSNPNAQRAAHLPNRKLQVLARLPAPVVDDLYDEGVLDQIDEMSREELTEIVRLRKDLANERKARENAELRLLGAADQSAAKPKNAWPDAVRLVRIESTALSDKANLCLDDMAALGAMMAKDDAFRFLEAEEFAAGASALYHNLRMLAAKATALVNGIEKELGADNCQSGDVPILTKAELQKVITKRGLMVDEHRIEKITRANAENITLPRKRGRPRKDAT